MNRLNRIYLVRISLQLIIFLIVPSMAIKAQAIKKEVYVISSYKPEVADADKISRLPAIHDTSSFSMKADYTVLPSHMKTNLTLRPIKPATMIGTPLDKLYNSYLKIGLGNYATPMIEYSIHNLRSKDYAIGAYLFHRSSYSNLDLRNNASVPAGYGINELKGYGKYFLKNATWSAEVGANTHRLRYYGLNVDDSIISVKSFGVETKEIKQSYTTFYGQTSIYSTNSDSGALHYSVGLEYLYDHFSNKEPHFNLNASLSQLYKGFMIGVDGNLDNYSLTDSSANYRNNLICIRPFLTRRGDIWEARLALKFFYENTNSSKTYLFPDASIRFKIIDKALSTYFGIDGYIEDNNYQSVTLENPYILPGLNVKNTKHNYIGYAGLEGQLSSKAAYRLNISLDAMENAHFFVNDTISKYKNQFNVVYDDADLIKFNAEVSWMALKNLSLFAKYNYYQYKMYNTYNETPEKMAWHKADYDMTFTARYNFKEKIFAEVNYEMIGKRYAKNFNDTSKISYELEPVHDLNLKLEYKYSNILSGFLHFYNLLSQRYYLWNQYPSQRLNILLGITYKF